jgi:hypothetical protein
MSASASVCGFRITTSPRCWAACSRCSSPFECSVLRGDRQSRCILECFGRLLEPIARANDIQSEVPHLYPGQRDLNSRFPRFDVHDWPALWQLPAIFRECYCRSRQPGLSATRAGELAESLNAPQIAGAHGARRARAARARRCEPVAAGRANQYVQGDEAAKAKPADVSSSWPFSG